MYRINIVGYVIGILGRVGVMIGGYMMNIPVMLACTAVASLGQSPLQGDLNALIACCSEHTYLKTGKRIDGMMYSCSSFGIKVGGSLGTAICGWMLGAVGYVENAAVQTAGTIDMLHFLYLWAPIIFFVLVTVVLSMLRVEKANADLLAKKV